MRKLIFHILVASIMLGVEPLALPSPSNAQYWITEVIDATGEGTNTLDGAWGVAVDSAGNVYVTGSYSDNAFKITPGGTVTEIIDVTGDGDGNTLNWPNGVAVDSSGNVYVVGLDSDNAFKIAPGGTVTEIIDSTGDGGGNTLDGLYGVAVDSSGNVYVAGYASDNAFKIAPGGTVTEIIDSTGDGGGNTLDGGWGVAVDSSGNVYVTGYASDNAFKIATPGTCSTSGTPCTITEIIDSTGDGGGNTLDEPHAIAVDSNDNVYVTGWITDNAFKIAPGGTVTEIIDSTGDGGGNTLDGSYGVAVDSSGNVYVTGLVSDNAFKIAPGGTVTEIIDSTGDGTNTLDGPTGIAVDSSGNAYVTGYYSDNAFKVAEPPPSWEVDISLTEILGALAPIEWSDTGVAAVGVAGGVLTSLRVPGAISGSTTIPITDPNLAPLLSLRWEGVGPGTITFNGISDGPPLGSKNTGGVQGQVKMCILFSGCFSYIPVPLTRNGTAGVGIGGLVTVNGYRGGIKISVQGAPWTIGTASITDVTTRTPNGLVTTDTVTIQGFVHGPASATSTVLQSGGVVQLVTPTLVQTTLTGKLPLTTALKVTFIPEPGSLLLLVAGVVGLVVFGRKRMRG